MFSKLKLKQLLRQEAKAAIVIMTSTDLISLEHGS